MCIYGNLCKYREGYTTSTCEYLAMTGNSKVLIRRLEGRTAPPDGLCEFFQPRKKLSATQQKRLDKKLEMLKQQRDGIIALVMAVEEQNVQAE